MAVQRDFSINPIDLSGIGKVFSALGEKRQQENTINTVAELLGEKSPRQIAGSEQEAQLASESNASAVIGQRPSSKQAAQAEPLRQGSVLSRLKSRAASELMVNNPQAFKFVSSILTQGQADEVAAARKSVLTQGKEAQFVLNASDPSMRNKRIEEVIRSRNAQGIPLGNLVDILSQRNPALQNIMLLKAVNSARDASEVLKPEKPQSPEGKLRADFDAGRISERTFKAARAGAGDGSAKLQTDVGRLVRDQQIITDEFGADSPQAAAINEAIESQRKGEKPDLKTVAGMRKEFTSLSGDFITMRDAVGKVRAASADPSAAGDLSTIFNFMKILDPNSVVRESEFATAQNSAGVPDRVRNIYNQVLNGQRLAPNQRKDFVDTAEKLFASQEGLQQRLVGEFTGIAERAKIDPQDVTVDFSGAPAQATALPTVTPVIGTDQNIDTSRFDQAPTATGPNGEKLILQNGQWVQF